MCDKCLCSTLSQMSGVTHKSYNQKEWKTFTYFHCFTMNQEKAIFAWIINKQQLKV